MDTNTNWTLGYSTDRYDLLKAEEDEKRRDRYDSDMPRLSNIPKSNKIEAWSIWIHRTYTTDIWVTFDSLAEAYSFGHAFLKEHSATIKDGEGPLVESWTDEYKRSWVSNYIPGPSIEEINGEDGEQFLGHSRSLQIMIYKGCKPPLNHETYYPYGIMKLPPSLTMSCGINGVPDTLPPTYRQADPTVFTWNHDDENEWKYSVLRTKALYFPVSHTHQP